MRPDELEVLRVHVAAHDAAVLEDWLLEQGAQGVESGEAGAARVRLTVYAEAPELERLAGALVQRWGPKGVECRREQLGIDWVRAYERGLRPIQLTPLTRLLPSREPNADVRTLHLEPGMYFGFGDHPTTALIARWLEVQAPGQRVLDVGTGTGVLALIAARAGARGVWGCDVDGASVEAARLNAARNRISGCHFTTQPASEIAERFDVVVANIEAGILVELAPAVRCRLRPRGSVALSGLLEDQVDWVTDGYRAAGIELRVAEVLEPWALLQGWVSRVERTGRTPQRGSPPPQHPDPGEPSDLSGPVGRVLDLSTAYPLFGCSVDLLISRWSA